MTRRTFIFVDDIEKKLYISPEFNGDQEEFEYRKRQLGTLDSCDLPSEDLYKMFKVRNLDHFQKACEEAQSHFHSFLDTQDKPKELIPAREITVSDLQQLYSDEFTFILKGDLCNAPSGWDGRLETLYQTVSTANMLSQVLNSIAEKQILGIIEYRQQILLSRAEWEIINGYLNAASADEYQDEDQTIIHSVRFSDGMCMDIKCCGCHESSWTEAVLFDQNGCEVTCTEPSDQFDGLWELEYDGVIYSVLVRIESEPPVENTLHKRTRLSVRKAGYHD